MAQTDGFDPRAPCAIETASILTIGDHNRDDGVETPIRDRVDQRLQIAAATGDQHTQSTARNRVASHGTYVTSGSPGTISPITLPPSADFTWSAWSAATATINPIPMLNVRSMSNVGTRPRSCSHVNTRGTLHD